MCKRLLQVLQEQRKDLQSDLNVTGPTNILTITTIFFVVESWNKDKMTKAKRDIWNQLSLDDKSTTQKKQHNTDRGGKPNHFQKGLHLVDVFEHEINLPQCALINKQEPKSTCTMTPRPHPSIHPSEASVHRKQWQSDVAPLQLIALS